jgi:outer membrane receptor for ferrienterochelin and colicins
MSRFKNSFSLLLLLMLFPGFLRDAVAQQSVVEGFVYEFSAGKSKNVPLPGATVVWSNSTQGTTTNSKGFFSLKIVPDLPALLVVSYVGYQSDTIRINNPGPITVALKSSVSLLTVNIEGRQDATLISTIKPINVEQIGKKELLKAACCNLSESFETNASVNVSYTDAITGAKEIQMLGLSGIYSQIMTENIPNVRGLAATYGLGYVPGPWMESIQITKGSGSVANGYESTSGQINVEYIKPETADNFYLNGYVASTGNVEVNAHKKIKVSDNASGILFVHGENSQTKWDHQDDSFLDMPLMSQANVFNRWSFNDGKKFEGQLGVKAIFEKRRSGQTFYDWENEADTTSGYGVQVTTKRLELFSKTGMVFTGKPWKSAGLILSGNIHDQESYFGLKTYDGKQNNFYGSLIYMSIISNTNHKWKAGVDFRYDDYSEVYLMDAFNRIESVPGIYAEYTLNVKEKFGLVAGSRIDYHNEWGLFYTPRLHMKYNFTENIIIRASGGRSFRTANVFADNSSIMATSRDLVITEKLNPERAWNFGANFTAKFRVWYRMGSISFDYYVTDFSNQVITDTYSRPDIIEIYNLKGDSWSKSFQVAFNYEAFKRFDVRLAYKNDRVVIDYNGIPSRKPLVPEHRALLNVSYGTVKENWRFDFTTHYQGETRLAISTATEDEITGHDDSQVKNGLSPDFFTFNAQVTYLIKKWELYLGGENLSGFRQETPVVNAMNPFEEGFDATNVWGPVMGRKIYFGFRYTLK